MNCMEIFVIFAFVFICSPSFLIHATLQSRKIGFGFYFCPAFYLQFKNFPVFSIIFFYTAVVTRFLHKTFEYVVFHYVYNEKLSQMNTRVQLIELYKRIEAV